MLLFQREIDRFLGYAIQRSTRDPFAIRRRHRRYHRSWPLCIGSYDSGCLQEYSAALHDASETGIGFMCERLFPLDAQLFVKLFWHEISGLRIPATVRHVRPRTHGVLVGCEYNLCDPAACDVALQMDATWNGLWMPERTPL